MKLFIHNVVFFAGHYFFFFILSIFVGFRIEYIKETMTGFLLWGVLIALVQLYLFKRYSFFIVSEHLASKLVKGGMILIELGFGFIAIYPNLIVISTFLLLGLISTWVGKKEKAQ